MWIAAAGLASVGFMSWAVRGRASAVLAPSVYKGPPNRRALALTFDDGPSEDTVQLLRILDKRGARATFFQCGVHVRRLSEVVRDVASAGHEVGNHTDTHPLLSLRTVGFIYNELARAQEAIATAAGAAPRYFRAPYGVRWFGLREAQNRLHLTGAMWTVMGSDWRLSGLEVARRVVSRTRPGSIVCLHDGRELQSKPDIRSTIQAVDRLVPELQDQGYRFETISQLLCQTN
jgi:peptidoglycan/xylan/chitin deacetylase (PgdA/CDA1 family)